MRIQNWLGTTVLLPAALSGQGVTVPDGWTARLDSPQTMAAGQKVTPGEWRYVEMAPGWHLTTTNAGVTVLPEDRTIHGRWGVEVTLFLFPHPSDAPFGIVLDDAAAGPDSPVELQFLLRRDGAVSLIAHHGQATEVGVPWQPDTTGTVAHDGTSVTKYVLRAIHESGNLTFSVNGVERFTFPTGGEDHEARPGFRLGPGLNVHIARFDLITPLAPAREMSPE